MGLMSKFRQCLVGVTWLPEAKSECFLPAGCRDWDCCCCPLEMMLPLVPGQFHVLPVQVKQVDWQGLQEDYVTPLALLSDEVGEEVEERHLLGGGSAEELEEEEQGGSMRPH